MRVFVSGKLSIQTVDKILLPISTFLAAWMLWVIATIICHAVRGYGVFHSHNNAIGGMVGLACALGVFLYLKYKE